MISPPYFQLNAVNVGDNVIDQPHDKGYVQITSRYLHDRPQVLK